MVSSEIERFRVRAQRGRLDATVGDWLDLRLGADWRLPERGVRWRTAIGALDSFVSEFGHAAVPTNHMQGDYKLGTWVASQRQNYRAGTLAPDRVAELESRPGWTWCRDSDVWVPALAALDLFIARESHARVRHGLEENGIKLGSWVSSQRTYYRVGVLAPDRIAELESRPGWTWDLHAEAWVAALAALDSFIAHELHAQVRRDADENGFKLGNWTYSQRKKFRAGTLAPDRVAELESRPGWTWDHEADGWVTALAALDSFIARKSHARVTKRLVDNGFKLGFWVSYQRQSYRAGTLAPDRVAELESRLGWAWDHEANVWLTALAALDSFITSESHARVPAGVDENGFKLGTWVSNQRKNYRAGTLGSDQITELESRLGWSWDPLADQWGTALAALDSFIARESHAPVKGNCIENDFNLGKWVSSRRRSYQAGTLSPARIAELESRPGWVWSTAKKPES